MGTLACAPSAVAANPTPAQAITELNSWRTQLGESPVNTTDVSTYDTGCQHHNNYEQQHDTLTHFETDTNPANGFTADGAVAGPDSVLANQITSPTPPPSISLLPGPTWDGAVFHRQAVLQPRLANVGYASTTFGSGNGPYFAWTCLWDQNIESPPLGGSPAALDNSRTTANFTLYPSPANGAFDVPTTFPGHESPDPNQETGVNGATLGWLISGEINGPWANSGNGGIVWTHDVSATLEPDGGSPIGVVVSECGSTHCALNGSQCDTSAGGTAYGCFFGGGFGIFPLEPLSADTTYHVAVSGTWTDLTNPALPVSHSFNSTWCFSTGPTYTTSGDCSASTTGAGGEPGVLEALQVSITGNGSVTGPGVTCPNACYDQYTAGSAVSLTAHAPAGQKFAGWSGACTGTQATCLVSMSSDRAVHATFVKISPPTITNGSLTVGQTRGTLKFTLHAGRNAPLLGSFVVTLPRGLTFSTIASALRQGVTMTGNPKHTASATASKLTVRLASPASIIAVKIATPALHAARNVPFRGEVLGITVTPTDARGAPTALHLTFSF